MSGWVQDVSGSFEVVGDGGQAGLQRGFGEASPSHASKTVRAFPGAEDLLDPAADLVDRAVPCGKASISLGLAPGPDVGNDDPWVSAACANRVSEHLAPISAVGLKVTRIVGKRRLAIAAVMGIARRDRDFLDQRGVRIGTDMGFIAVNGLA